MHVLNSVAQNNSNALIYFRNVLKNTKNHKGKY